MATKNDGSNLEIQVPNRMKVRSGAKGIVLPVGILNDVMQEVGKGKGTPYGVTIMAFLGTVEGSKYNAPSVEKATKDQVTVYSRFNSQKSKTFEIEVEPDPLKTPSSPKVPKIIVPKGLKVNSGSMIHIPVTVENSSKGVSYAPAEGRVENGNFHAPQVTVNKKVAILVTSVEFPSLSKSIQVEVEAVTVNININVPVDMKVASGAKVELPVGVTGDVWNQTEGKFYGVICTPAIGRMEGEKYVAPEVEQVITDTIVVRSRYSSAVSKSFQIEVEPKPRKTETPKVLKIHVPANLETVSEGKIPLTVSVENDPENKEVDFFPEQGLVEEGNFIAPRVDENLPVKIKVVSKADPSKSAKIDVLVKAVEIKTSPIPATINVGGPKVDFHIQTLNDPSGNLKNFTCRIVSGKGELTSNGVYVPPEKFRAIEEVVFQVRSTYTGRELEFRFELHPPLCNICNFREVDPATGDCPNCGATKYSRTATQFKCKGCGQPLIPGETCKKCGYPKAGILKFF